MTNAKFAQSLLRRLLQQGLKEFIFCAGARNAPLIHALSRLEGVPTVNFFDERSAGFFALGRAKALGAPVAVITTSGTAVAELLPAVIEAHYTGAPLVVISADRPKEMRYTGAPQTIIQPGIYSHYVSQTHDIDVHSDLDFSLDTTSVVHINVCFSEPLMDEQLQRWQEPTPLPSRSPMPLPTGALQKTEEFFRKSHRPLIVVAGLREDERSVVKRWLLKQEAPFYLEGPSGLRGDSDLKDRELQAGDKNLPHLKFDGVIRIGQIPTVRLWRDLDAVQIPVLSFSNLPFTGLSLTDAEVVPLCVLEQVEHLRVQWADLKEVTAADKEQSERLLELFQRYPLAEPSWINFISRQISSSDLVYLGNSLPIREWDLAADRKSQPSVWANRGANGIDGQISTFLGVSRPAARNWAILGDLTCMYDMNGFWALQCREPLDIRVVVMNNSGGRIFERLFNEPLFYNQHRLNFSSLAGFWNLTYQKMETPSDEDFSRSLIEITPDAEQTHLFWEAF